MNDREKIVKSYIDGYNQFNCDKMLVDFDDNAVLAMDFPNGLKKGDELKLKGKSNFRFLNNKIIKLTDIS